MTLLRKAFDLHRVNSITLLVMIETNRLFLRPHLPEDVPYMIALNSDPEVVRYTGDGPLESEDEALAIVARLQRQKDLWRMGRLIVLDRVTGEKLGWCGLRWHETEQVTDLGYRFFRRYWNQGYATESSIACLDYGFDELGLNRIVAHAMEENVASVRVLEKLGFHRKGYETLAGFAGLGFELRREEWQGSKERRLSWTRK